MTDKRTEISDLGEFGLIEHLQKNFSNNQPTTSLGMGDDAAILDFETGSTIISKDLMLEGVHFDLRYMPLKHLGYKAVTINVSDIAAMYAEPTQCLVGIGLSNRFSLEAVEELYAGIRQACEDYRIDLVGGDTVSSAAGLVLSITAIGKADKSKATLRSHAQKNDLICVSGDLGGAYLGLQILEREKAVFLSNPDMQPTIDKYEYVIGRQLRPKARMDIVYELKELNVQPNAMIDISDGLSSELLHISNSSHVGVKIFEDKIPIDQRSIQAAFEFKIDPLTCALHGGEDYELLFTIAQSDFEKIKNHPDIHIIGHIHENNKQNTLISKAGTEVAITSQGWKHF